MNMLRGAIIIIAATSVCLPVTLALSKANQEKVEKVVKSFKCKGETVDFDRTMSLLNQRCKNDMKKGVVCTMICYFVASGLYDEDYRLYSNETKATKRMLDVGINSKKMTKMLTDIFRDSNCVSKFPPKGTDDCRKVYKGTLCVTLKLNKNCDLAWDKLIVDQSKATNTQL